MIILKENTLDVSSYMQLRQSVKWKKLTLDQAQKALDNSMYVLSAYDDETDKVVGMGRIVGDGAVICYVQDLIIHPCEQHSGLGSVLLQRLITYVRSEGIEGTGMMMDLMCAKGREDFYIKNGFIARPTSNLGPGMILYLDI